MFIYHCGAFGNAMDFAASTEKHAYTGIKMQALLLLHCLASEYSLRILSPALPPLFCRKNFPVHSIYGDARTAAVPPCSAELCPAGAVPAPCIPLLPVKMLHRCLLHKVGICLPAVRIHLFRCLYFSIGSASLQSHGAGVRKHIARIYHFQL